MASGIWIISIIFFILSIIVNRDPVLVIYTLLVIKNILVYKSLNNQNIFKGKSLQILDHNGRGPTSSIAYAC